MTLVLRRLVPILIIAATAGCGRSDSTGNQERTVTIYVSTDRVFSEPVLREYERRSGVKVNPVYDTEETKSTGLANRLLAQNIVGNAPFYTLSEIQGALKAQDGLGGSGSVRGLPKDRYVGKGVLVSNNELRWRAANFSLLGRESSVVLSGFYDVGRVWTDGIDLSSALDELHSGFGGGVRLGLGSSFVVAVDAAHSAQSTLPIYIGLGYLF